MHLRNSRTTYGSISKLFHWVVATLFICQFYWIGAKKYLLPEKSKLGIKYLVDYHKPTGTVLLLLVTLMILWKFASIKPYYLKSMPAWEKLTAKVVQFILYLTMFLMPLSGFLMTLYSGRSINMFGYYTISNITEVNKALAGFFHEVHEYTGYACFVLISLHIFAALKHHFYDKDKILRRMLPFFNSKD